MRACGNCGKTGHNRRTCSNAPVAKAAKVKKARVAKPKVAKVKKPRTNKYGTLARCHYCRERSGHSAASCDVRNAHNERAAVLELQARTDALNSLTAMGFDLGALVAVSVGYPNKVALKVVRKMRWQMEFNVSDPSDANSQIQVNSRLLFHGLLSGSTAGDEAKQRPYWAETDYDHAVFVQAADATMLSVDALSQVIAANNCPRGTKAAGFYVDASLISGVPTNKEKVASHITVDVQRTRKRGQKKSNKNVVGDFLTLPKKLL
jgi:hypothetical protein